MSDTQKLLGNYKGHLYYSIIVYRDRLMVDQKTDFESFERILNMYPECECDFRYISKEVSQKFIDRMNNRLKLVNPKRKNVAIRVRKVVNRALEELVSSKGNLEGLLPLPSVSS